MFELPNGVAIKYVHVRNDRSPRGGVCYALEVENDMVVAVAVARCHYKDNYNKRVGRTIARSRLFQDAHRIDLQPKSVEEAVQTLTSTAVNELAYERMERDQIAVLRRMLRTLKSRESTT